MFLAETNKERSIAVSCPKRQTEKNAVIYHASFFYTITAINLPR